MQTCRKYGRTLPIPTVSAKPLATLSFLFLSAAFSSVVTYASAQNRTTPKEDRCRAHAVTSLPGSHHFGSNFLEALSGDRATVFGLSADLSDSIPLSDRAMYISKSIDGGTTWVAVARVGSEYFDSDIGEGERNGLAVAHGGKEFVLTTQKGAFQVIPRGQETVVRAIPGPRVLAPDPMVTTPKKAGDPVTANVVKMTPDGRRLIVGYGYFDFHPQIFAYRRDKDGYWVRDKSLPPLPTDMDLLSIEFGAAGSLYLGTGDQAFRLKSHAKAWTRVDGVGDDSAIQQISTIGGPHMAACWGVYEPVNADTVERVTQATFLLHRNEDEAGSTIRAFGIAVDPKRPKRQVVTSLTGAYASQDSGAHWKRLNDLPAGEFREAYFNRDGTVIVSGIAGTFLADPFAPQCTAHLRTR
jgi:hypothetical protein